MGPRAVRPFFLEAYSLSTANVYVSQPPSHGIEAGGHDQNVQFVLAIPRLYALWGYSLDRRLVDVNDIDIVLIEDLVIKPLQRRALDSERMGRIRGRQLLRNGGIGDPCSGFIPPESVEGVICLFVQQHVLERG